MLRVINLGGGTVPEKIFRTIIAAGCAYEVFALVTGKTPPLTKFCREHRSFEVTLLACLIFHFHWEEEAWRRMKRLR